MAKKKPKKTTAVPKHSRNDRRRCTRWQDVQTWDDVDKLRLTPEEMAEFEEDILTGGPVAERLWNRDAVASDIGVKAHDRGRELILPVAEGFPEWVDGFEEKFGLLPDEARECLIMKLCLVLERGYILAAGDAADSRRAGAKSGARLNAEKAVATRRRIIDAYDATDSSLSDAERYAAVQASTGVKSLTTIRNALRLR